MKRVASEVGRALTDRKVKQVAVGKVVKADASSSTAEPTLRKLLEEELARPGLTVREGADVVLDLTYRGQKVPLKTDRKKETLIVELTCTATFTRLREQVDLLSAFRIDNEEAVRIILGLTGPNTGNEAQRGAAAILSFEKPKVVRDGTVLLDEARGLYGMEILVNGKAIAPEGGVIPAQVELARDQSYAVRLVNRSKHEVAVRLSIDGLSIFTFSELRHKDGPFKDAPLYDMVLIRAMDSVTIEGWHRNNTTWNKFKITQYADAPAAKLGKTSEMGTIAATFSAAWEKTPPEDEPDGSRDPDKDGTGFGEPVKVKATPVQRTIGIVRGSVAVHYKIPGPGK
jgi:hypothetical protein